MFGTIVAQTLTGTSAKLKESTEFSTKIGGLERFYGVHRSMIITVGQVRLTIAGSITGSTTIVLAF
jgi:hypothetical protein